MIQNTWSRSLTEKKRTYKSRLSACLPTPSYRIDSTSEDSSSSPATGARARATVVSEPTLAGLTRGGRKQASVRAKKTKQLRRTSKKELKVELANVCT